MNTGGFKNLCCLIELDKNLRARDRHVDVIGIAGAQDTQHTPAHRGSHEHAGFKLLQGLRSTSIGAV